MRKANGSKRWIVYLEGRENHDYTVILLKLETWLQPHPGAPT